MHHLLLGPVTYFTPFIPNITVFRYECGSTHFVVHDEESTSVYCKTTLQKSLKKYNAFRDAIMTNRTNSVPYDLSAVHYLAVVRFTANANGF